jgi:hypothetical protein
MFFIHDLLEFVFFLNFYVCVFLQFLVSILFIIPLLTFSIIHSMLCKALCFNQLFEFTMDFGKLVALKTIVIIIKTLPYVWDEDDS